MGGGVRSTADFGAGRRRGSGIGSSAKCRVLPTNVEKWIEKFISLVRRSSPDHCHLLRVLRLLSEPLYSCPIQLEHIVYIILDQGEDRPARTLAQSSLA
jgi:hypothetical protein